MKIYLNLSKLCIVNHRLFFSRTRCIIAILDFFSVLAAVSYNVSLFVPCTPRQLNAFQFAHSRSARNEHRNKGTSEIPRGGIGAAQTPLVVRKIHYKNIACKVMRMFLLLW